MRLMSCGRGFGLALILGLALLSAPAAMAQAQTAAKPSAAQVALARQLVEANGEARAFEGVIPNIVDGAALSFVQTNPDLAKSLREVALSLRPEFEKRGSEIVDIIANVYASRFTDAELKEALAFYQTATGKKLVAERANIVQTTVQAIQAWGAQMNGLALQRIREEMKKRGVDL